MRQKGKVQTKLVRVKTSKQTLLVKDKHSASTALTQFVANAVWNKKVEKKSNLLYFSLEIPSSYSENRLYYVAFLPVWVSEYCMSLLSYNNKYFQSKQKY